MASDLLLKLNFGSMDIRHVDPLICLTVVVRESVDDFLVPTGTAHVTVQLKVFIKLQKILRVLL